MKQTKGFGAWSRQMESGAAEFLSMAAGDQAGGMKRHRLGLLMLKPRKASEKRFGSAAMKRLTVGVSGEHSEAVRVHCTPG